MAGISGCTGDRGGDGGGVGQDDPGGAGGDGGGGGSDPTPTGGGEDGTPTPEYASGTWAQWEKNGTQQLRKHRSTVSSEKTAAEYKNGVAYGDVLLDDNFHPVSAYKQAGKKDEFVDDINDLSVHMFRTLTPDMYASASQTEEDGPVDEILFRWFKGEGAHAEHRFTPDEAYEMWKEGKKEAIENDAPQSEILDYIDKQYLEDLRKDIRFVG